MTEFVYCGGSCLLHQVLWKWYQISRQEKFFYKMLFTNKVLVQKKPMWAGNAQGFIIKFIHCSVASVVFWRAPKRVQPSSLSRENSFLTCTFLLKCLILHNVGAFPVELGQDNRLLNLCMRMFFRVNCFQRCWLLTPGFIKILRKFKGKIWTSP